MGFQDEFYQLAELDIRDSTAGDIGVYAVHYNHLLIGNDEYVMPSGAARREGCVVWAQIVI